MDWVQNVHTPVHRAKEILNVSEQGVVNPTFPLLINTHGEGSGVLSVSNWGSCHLVAGMGPLHIPFPELQPLKVCCLYGEGGYVASMERVVGISLSMA